MANIPHKDTITVSFTLPSWLNEKVEIKAKSELTNKSDIIRRALLAHVGGLSEVPDQGKSPEGHGSQSMAAEEAGEYKTKNKEA